MKARTRTTSLATIVVAILASSIAMGAKADTTAAKARPSLKGPLVGYCCQAPPADAKWLIMSIRINGNTTPAAAAAESLTKPTGMAAMFLFDGPGPALPYNFDNFPGDKPGSPLTEASKPGEAGPNDDAVAQFSARFTKFLTAYKAAGGRIDYLMTDCEGGKSMWNLKPDDLRALWNDPRSAKIRSMLDFTNVEAVYHGRYLDWNAAACVVYTAALNKAFFEPVHNLYPNAGGSNYWNFTMPRDRVVPELNGHKAYTIGNGNVGTEGAPVLYCRLFGISKSLLDGKHPYGNSPFAGLRYGINYMRAAEPPVAPWVGYKGYKASATCNTPYYEELIYHVALSGATKLLYWNPQTNPASKKPDWSSPDQDRVLDTCLVEINNRFGDLARSPITTEIMPWDIALVVSGMRVGNTSLWRVTAPPGVSKIKVMPSNKVLELNGGVGAWYTGKADERPTFIGVTE